MTTAASPEARAEFYRKSRVILEAFQVSLISREKAQQAIETLRKKYLG